MKTRSFWILIAGCAAIFAALPVDAHHSFAAEFDATKVVELTGIVVRLEWANPHARIYMDVKDDKGALVRWDFEMGSPNGLMRLGWNRNSIKAGDEITVNGTLAKNAPHVGNARSVVMTKTGKRLFAGSSEGEPANQ
jgi:hypothetical protein